MQAVFGGVHYEVECPHGVDLTVRQTEGEFGQPGLHPSINLRKTEPPEQHPTAAPTPKNARPTTKHRQRVGPGRPTLQHDEPSVEPRLKQHRQVQKIIQITLKETQ